MYIFVFYNLLFYRLDEKNVTCRAVNTELEGRDLETFYTISAHCKWFIYTSKTDFIDNQWDLAAIRAHALRAPIFFMLINMRNGALLPPLPIAATR